MSKPAALIQKLWNYCNILRDDGLLGENCCLNGRQIHSATCLLLQREWL